MLDSDDTYDIDDLELFTGELWDDLQSPSYGAALAGSGLATEHFLIGSRSRSSSPFEEVQYDTSLLMTPELSLDWSVFPLSAPEPTAATPSAPLPPPRHELLFNLDAACSELPMLQPYQAPRLFNLDAYRRYPSRAELDAAQCDGHLRRDLLTWYQRFDELINYAEQHGNCDVPHRYFVNPSLGLWVHKQRTEKEFWEDGKPSTLTIQRIDYLDSIGFCWTNDHGNKSWMDRFAELQTYKEQHGHCNVPGSCKINPALGRWVKRQREKYKLFQSGVETKTLTQSRVDMLDGLGFVWDGQLLTLSARRRAAKLALQQQQQPLVAQERNSTPLSHTARLPPATRTVTMSSSKSTRAKQPPTTKSAHRRRKRTKAKPLTERRQQQQKQKQQQQQGIHFVRQFYTSLSHRARLPPLTPTVKMPARKTIHAQQERLWMHNFYTSLSQLARLPPLTPTVKMPARKTMYAQQERLWMQNFYTALSRTAKLPPPTTTTHGTV